MNIGSLHMITSDMEACKWLALALNNFQRAYHDELAKGTFFSILRQANMSVDEFLKKWLRI